jgi:aminopeptidase N
MLKSGPDSGPVLMNRAYRYNRADVHPLPVTLEHLALILSFREDGAVAVGNTLHMTAREPLDTVTLDARDLEVQAVAGAGPEGAWTEADFTYRPEQARLTVRLPEPVAVGTRFRIRTQTVCVPSDSILEGIYRDTTPPGCPPQYISQCQQWGFQRIAPVFDDCTAKCTMTTTLEADARYTHLISNGDVDRVLCPDGRPVPLPDNPARRRIRYRNAVPMAPYLFIVAVGTWDVLEDKVVYPSGRQVRLEYLVPPGRRDGARIPMQILKDAVLWQGRTQAYTYPYEVYRTLCMEKSNFGGMENVGNTTIVTSAALIDAFTGDARLEYAYGVIVHEFEHNQCGSDVTMETPFDMWLNEAYTVDVERRFSAEYFDRDVVRLREVDAIRAPLHGPLAVEDGGHLGNIVREGFNHPDELVDGVTYVKAAEVIRMLRLLIGPDTFRAGAQLYFARYHGGNANTGQFFACFEEAAGMDLAAFRREWLYTIGYPVVEAEWTHDATAGLLRVRCVQTRTGAGGAFVVPLSLAAVDDAGRDGPGTAVTLTLDRPVVEHTLPLARPPAFVSLNRDASFYGVFHDRSATPETLARQVRLDPNGFNRVEAMRRLTDRERRALLDDPGATVSPSWLAVYGEVLADTVLPPGLKAYLLRIEEQSSDRATLPLYRERYAARLRLLRVLAERFAAPLRDAFDAVDTYRPATEPRDGIEDRALKAVLLRTLIEADTPDVHALAETHYRGAWNFSDKTAALHALNQSTSPRRAALLEDAFTAWHGHLNGYTAYLGVVASGRAADTFDAVAREEARPLFNPRHPGHTRALYLSLASNNALLWTERGLRWAADTAIKLAPLNAHTTLRLIDAFRLVAKLPQDLRPLVVRALETIRDGVDAERCPSVAGRVRAYLA